MENRKRDVQHVEEPGLQPRTQLWPWSAKSVDSVLVTDVPRIPSGSDSASDLPIVSSSTKQVSNSQGILEAPLGVLYALGASELGRVVPNDC